MIQSGRRATFSRRSACSSWIYFYSKPHELIARRVQEPPTAAAEIENVTSNRHAANNF